MRELEYTIDKALLVGLSPYDKTPVNAEVLSECLGFIIKESGPHEYNLLTNPINPLVLKYSWPFPQVVQGEKYNFLVIRDTIGSQDIIYSISDDHSIVTQLAIIDELTYGQGTLTEVADFGNYAIMTNGVAIVYYDVVGVTWTIMTGSDSIPLLKTICNFKGQAIGGGVKDSWNGCDEKFYCWSNIGELDFEHSLRNESGYRRCPYGGDVQHVRRLGDFVIGYSSKGITQIFPVTEPATFGFKEISPIGIINQGAMNGDLIEQLYVGSDYRIRRVSSEGISVLGYRQQMENLTNNDIIVSFDKVNRYYFISDGITTYLLSNKGLSQIPQHPSTVWNQDISYCLPVTSDTYDLTIASSYIDFGYAGQKTVCLVETDMENGEDVLVEIDYDFGNISGTTDSVPFNNQMLSSILSSGNRFIIRIKSTPTYNDVGINYIKVRFKMTDLRGIRGVYAPSPRGQF